MHLLVEMTVLYPVRSPPRQHESEESCVK
jgi:hypothetical protein